MGENVEQLRRGLLRAGRQYSAIISQLQNKSKDSRTITRSRQGGTWSHIMLASGIPFQCHFERAKERNAYAARRRGMCCRVSTNNAFLSQKAHSYTIGDRPLWKYISKIFFKSDDVYMPPQSVKNFAPISLYEKSQLRSVMMCDTPKCL